MTGWLQDPFLLLLMRSNSHVIVKISPDLLYEYVRTAPMHFPCCVRATLKVRNIYLHECNAGEFAEVPRSAERTTMEEEGTTWVQGVIYAHSGELGIAPTIYHRQRGLPDNTAESEF